MSISYCISLFVKMFGKQPKVVSVYREIYGFGYVFLVDGRYLLYQFCSSNWAWAMLSKKKAYSFKHCNSCYELTNTYDCVTKKFLSVNEPHTVLI